MALPSGLMRKSVCGSAASDLSFGPGDCAAHLAAAEIDPAVEPPLRIVDGPLHDLDGEPREERFPHLGHAVAVAVRQEENVWAAGDNSIRREASTHAVAGRDAASAKTVTFIAAACGVRLDPLDRAVAFFLRRPP